MITMSRIRETETRILPTQIQRKQHILYSKTIKGSAALRINTSR